jgi:hypothetical protein
MRSERGQASVEWIVLVLLLALALTALARFAPRANARDVGADLVRTITCAARGGCAATGRARGPISAMGEGSDKGQGGAKGQRRAKGPGGAQGPGGAMRPADDAPPGSAPRALVTVPPLVPVVPRAPGFAPPRLPGMRPLPGTRLLPGTRPLAGTRPLPAPRPRAWLRPPRFGPLVRRARRRAGVLWRRSWMLCLGYERLRYSVLHPDIRFTQRTIPLSEGVRIANDCLSPVDLVRDFGKPPKP